MCADCEEMDRLIAALRGDDLTADDRDQIIAVLQARKDANAEASGEGW